MNPTVIFDNTVFNISARIDICDIVQLSKNLFYNMLVPEAIFYEIQQFPLGHEPRADAKMQLYARNILLRKAGLQLCTTYDVIVLANISTLKDVDRGEAEAIAQAEKRDVKYFFTDDEKCIKSLEGLYAHIKFVPTLFLICLLDIENYLIDYQKVIQEYFAYKPLPKKGGKKYFREIYAQALEYYGLPPDKKKINLKTSFKILGIPE